MENIPIRYKYMYEGRMFRVQLVGGHPNYGFKVEGMGTCAYVEIISQDEFAVSFDELDQYASIYSLGDDFKTNGNVENDPIDCACKEIIALAKESTTQQSSFFWRRFNGLKDDDALTKLRTGIFK